MTILAESELLQVLERLVPPICAVLLAYISYLGLKFKAQQEEVAVKMDKAAKEVKEVKTTLEEATTKQAENAIKQGDKLDSVAIQVNQIEKATNSMKDALVLATEKEALARGKLTGAQEEKDRVK